MRQTIKFFLFYSGILDLIHRLITFHLKVAMILRYHSVADFIDDLNCYASEAITVSCQDFDSQIRYLSKRYNIIPLSELINCLRENRDIPKNALVITFDDGYMDNYTNAYPILKKYGATATFYITAGCVEERKMLWMHKVIYMARNTGIKEIEVNGVRFDMKDGNTAVRGITSMIKKRRQDDRDEFIRDIAMRLGVTFDEKRFECVLMRWENMIEMKRDGFSFGAHTMNHPNLPNSSFDDAMYELTKSKRIIEERLSHPVKHFSYPNGGAEAHYNEEVKKMVQRCDYYSATTSVDGIVDKKSDLYELRRKGVAKGVKLYDLSTQIVFEKLKWWIMGGR